MKNLINTAVRTAMVAKINLGAFLPKELVDMELVSNLNDCFLITEEFANNMETAFRVPKSYLTRTEMDRNFEESELLEACEGIEYNLNEFSQKRLENLRRIRTEGVSHVCPQAGDKLIGSNRDKGSVTKVMDKFAPVAKMKFDTVEETKRFFEFMLQIGKQPTYVSDTEFHIFVDVLANPSTSRDNVGALALNSLMEWKAISEGTESILSPEEVLAIDLNELAKEYPCSFEVVMINTQFEEVYSFGFVPMMIEDFFWQPQHGNEFVIKEKSVSLNYNQARDAIKVLAPTLAKVMVETADFKSVKEDMLLLGLEIGSVTGIIPGVITETVNEVVKLTTEQELA